MILKISREDLEKIFKHAIECFPTECCGILAGKRLKEGNVVEKVYPTRNLLESSFEYQLDPEEQVRIFKDAETHGLEVIGFYHSHTISDTYWSRVDDERSKLWPGYVFLVVSPKSGNFRAYFRGENGTIEIQVKFL
ncbi:MAG: M67 family metallopeptidase [Candidatus Bathyarchaeia archaeon]